MIKMGRIISYPTDIPDENSYFVMDRVDGVVNSVKAPRLAEALINLIDTDSFGAKVEEVIDSNRGATKIGSIVDSKLVEFLDSESGESFANDLINLSATRTFEDKILSTLNETGGEAIANLIFFSVSTNAIFPYILDRFADGAMRRRMFRGENLGRVLTTDQKENIQNGSFKGLFLGDYWTDSSGVSWRIADFNYYNNAGVDIGNHIVVVPDYPIFSDELPYMDVVGLSEYVGGLYDRILEKYSPISALFPDKNITEHPQYLDYDMTSYGRDDIRADILNEISLFGCYANTYCSENFNRSPKIPLQQLSLFAIKPEYISCNQRNVLLNGIKNLYNYCGVGKYGEPCMVPNAEIANIRPVLAINGM